MSRSTPRPIGQNARSTPATYSGAFDHIRRLFAETPYARRRRWKPGHFSFNTREGQCPTCRGLGHIDLDVQYLPDISVECPTCRGARFNDATLAVRVDGLTVADVLGLSVHDALARFADRAPVASALQPVEEVGLGYLRLGEPTPSLSGGESQRLRIASRLRTSQHGTLYVFDEPSTGLHPLDVATLVGVFDRLIDAGATIIVIDHDLDLLAAADHLIDMGPGGGPDGGHILATGTPEEVAAFPGQRHRALAGRVPGHPADPSGQCAVSQLALVIEPAERWARSSPAVIHTRLSGPRLRRDVGRNRCGSLAKASTRSCGGCLDGVRLPLVEGVALTSQDRVLIAADSANGLSLSLPLEQWFSIPPTMTATLLRPSAGEWVHLACRTHLTDDGVGLAHADLFDTDGFVGEVAQPLLVQRRELDKG